MRDELVARLDLAWMAGRFPTTLRGDSFGVDLCCVSALGLLSAVEWMLTLIAAGSLAGVVDTSDEQDAQERPAGTDPQVRRYTRRRGQPHIV